MPLCLRWLTCFISSGEAFPCHSLLHHWHATSLPLPPQDCIWRHTISLRPSILGTYRKA